MGWGRHRRQRESTWLLGGHQRGNTPHELCYFDHIIRALKSGDGGGGQDPQPRAGAARGDKIWHWVAREGSGGSSEPSGSAEPGAVYCALWLDYTTYSNSPRTASNFTDLPSRHHFLKVSPGLRGSKSPLVVTKQSMQISGCRTALLGPESPFSLLWLLHVGF